MALTLDGTAGVTTPSGALYNGIAQGTSVASTSGTSITFTGIPSWVKRVTVMFQSASTSGTSGIRLQIGSGSVTTTGYSNTACVVANAATTGTSTSTSGLDSYIITAATSLFGTAIFSLIGSNLWVGTLTLGSTTEVRMFTSTSSVTLSGALDRVVITTVNGTDTFDAGSINIMWK